MSLADALERAAEALPADADEIRPANGDPFQLLQVLDAPARGRVLGWLLHNEPEDSGELLATWLDEEAGAEAVLAVDEAALPKPGRKALRRARHALRSRGIAAPASKASAPRVARLPQIDDDLTVAYVSRLDPRGSSLVFLVEPHPAGGARLFEALVDDDRGILDFQVFSAGRSKVRGFVKEMLARPGFDAVEVEPELARARILAVGDRHPSDRPLPQSFGEWAHRFRQHTGETPGRVVEKGLEPAERGPSLLRIAEAVREGRMGPWPPAVERLSGVAERLRESADSAVIVSDATREERFGALLGEEAEQVYGAEEAAIAATRLRETAFIDWKTGSTEDARAALAVALAFEDSAESARPVAVAMLEQALGGVLEQLEAQAASETGDDAGADDTEPGTNAGENET